MLESKSKPPYNYTDLNPWLETGAHETPCSIWIGSKEDMSRYSMRCNGEAPGDRDWNRCPREKGGTRKWHGSQGRLGPGAIKSRWRDSLLVTGAGTKAGCW